MNKFNKRKLLVLLLLLVFISILAIFKHPLPRAVKIGYFHGGRTTILYRSYVYNDFEKEGLDLKLITKNLYQNSFKIVPKDIEAIKGDRTFGRVTGEELIDEMIKGQFDGVATGEDSFIRAATKDLPIVAVAKLGRGLEDRPHRAILFRKDVIVKTPEDIKGKVLALRRAGVGDKALLFQYLRKTGLDPERDVTILEDVPDDQLDKYLRDKRIDGAFYHVNGALKVLQSGDAYIYKVMDWVDPQVIGALLVFRRDFVKENPHIVEKVIKVYMKRIKEEKALSPEQKLSSGEGGYKGLKLAANSLQLEMPQYDYPPIVLSDQLEQVQEDCYEYQGQLLRSSLKYDSPKIASICTEAGKVEYAESCVRGLGHSISQIYLTDPNKSKAECISMQGDYQYICQIAVAEELVFQKQPYQIAKSLFCDQLPSNWSKDCLSRIDIQRRLQQS